MYKTRERILSMIDNIKNEEHLDIIYYFLIGYTSKLNTVEKDNNTIKLRANIREEI